MECRREQTMGGSDTSSICSRLSRPINKHVVNDDSMEGDNHLVPNVWIYQKPLRVLISHERIAAHNLWMEVTALIDMVSVQSSCLSAKCSELTTREMTMINDKERNVINQYHRMCNILNHRCDDDPGNNLLSHQIVQYVYENNLVFTYPNVMKKHQLKSS